MANKDAAFESLTTLEPCRLNVQPSCAKDYQLHDKIAQSVPESLVLNQVKMLTIIYIYDFVKVKYLLVVRKYIYQRLPSQQDTLAANTQNMSCLEVGETAFGNIRVLNQNEQGYYRSDRGTQTNQHHEPEWKLEL